MDVVSPLPFWRLKNGLQRSLKCLDQDLKADVVIVGGGISGLLTAYHLCEAGIDTVLIDKFDIAAASTSASTALLQYEIDVPLIELAKLRSQEIADAAYLASVGAIGKIGAIAKKIGHEEFRTRKSLFLASSEEDAEMLSKEYTARKRIGIDVEFLTDAHLRRMFPFSNRAAILSATAAEIDPYKFTYQLLDACLAMGLRAYDRTHMKTFKFDGPDAPVIVQTEAGHKIETKDLVIATGYDAASFLPSELISLKSTFALATKPMADADEHLQGCLIWESSHPYCYMRATPDGRIIFGGLDEDFTNPQLRDKILHRKEKELCQRLQKYFPKINFEMGYSWAGTFCETKDGLPVIGTPPGAYHCLFALGYGGNGITFSLLAAEIIRDQLLGRPNALAPLFSFDRLIKS